MILGITLLSSLLCDTIEPSEPKRSAIAVMKPVMVAGLSCFFLCKGNIRKQLFEEQMMTRRASCSVYTISHKGTTLRCILL